jgi:transcription antitermination factor NusG
MEVKWYAVYTKPKWEKKVAYNMSLAGIENYCPLNRVVRKWSDRKKVIYEPLFTSYVFFRTSDKLVDKIKLVNGVVGIVSWLGKPAIIRDSEIETICQFLNAHQSVRIEKSVIKANDQIRIIDGPFKNQEGKVIELNNKSVKVELPSLGFMMIAEVATNKVIIR